MAQSVTSNAARMQKFTATGAVNSGDVIVVGERIGVYKGLKPAVSGDVIALSFEGVERMAALSSDTWSAGAQLYWDDSNNRLTSTASTHKTAGIAAADKADGDTTALCDINAPVTDTTVE